MHEQRSLLNNNIIRPLDNQSTKKKIAVALARVPKNESTSETPQSHGPSGACKAALLMQMSEPCSSGEHATSKVKWQNNTKETRKAKCSRLSGCVTRGCEACEARPDKMGHSSSGRMREAAEVCEGGMAEGEVTLLPPPPPPPGVPGSRLIHNNTVDTPPTREQNLPTSADLVICPISRSRRPRLQVHDGTTQCRMSHKKKKGKFIFSFANQGYCNCLQREAEVSILVHNASMLTSFCLDIVF